MRWIRPAPIASPCRRRGARGAACGSPRTRGSGCGSDHGSRRRAGLHVVPATATGQPVAYKPQGSRAAFATKDQTLPISPPVGTRQDPLPPLRPAPTMAPGPAAAPAPKAAPPPARRPEAPRVDPAQPHCPDRNREIPARAHTRRLAMGHPPWNVAHHGRLRRVRAIDLSGAVGHLSEIRQKTEPPSAPLKAQLVLKSATPGATITVGSVVGKPDGNLESEFAPGAYTVEVSRDGYETYHGTVSVPAAGLNQTLPELAAAGYRSSHQHRCADRQDPPGRPAGSQLRPV